MKHDYLGLVIGLAGLTLPLVIICIVMCYDHYLDNKWFRDRYKEEIKP